MDWRRTANALVAIGVAALVVGYIWRDGERDSYAECQVRGLADCQMSGGPTVALVVGAVLVAVGVALRFGASRPDALR